MKMYAIVTKVTQIETRNKKDGSGTYEYADLTLQLYDKDAKPGVHADYTGINALPDQVRFDAVRDRAVALNDQKFAVGEVCIIEVAAYVNRYGTNEMKVVSVERYEANQPTPRP